MADPPRARVRLGPGREFDLIRRFTARLDALPAEVRLGPGDDAAVLRGGWVISTDLSIEDVHYRRRWITDEEVGYRAAAVAASDLAAMAADPVALLVSIAADPGAGVDLEAVDGGLHALADSVGATIIGGDLSRSPGPLVIDVIALGRSAWPVQRDGAEAGDEVWVTGPLGGSAAAVELWGIGRIPSDALRQAFARPTPRIEVARCLAEEEIADALIDLSDGLAGDVGHIAAASGVRVALSEEKIPVHAGAVAAVGGTRGLELALHGGEDYELCFVCAPGAADAADLARRFGVTATRVGRVERGSGVWLRSPEGGSVELRAGGFDHWRGEAGGRDADAGSA